jgi:predicted kinase
MAGLPGSGKSTLARGLAEQSAFQVIRSDVVRKELSQSPNGGAQHEELYTKEWDERTYDECRRRAASLLFEGGRVLIDATFRLQRQRASFLNLARQWGVPGILFVCETQPEVARQRLTARRGDVSDADWAVYLQLRATWEAPQAGNGQALYRLDANRPPSQVLAQALAYLAMVGL